MNIFQKLVKTVVDTYKNVMGPGTYHYEVPPEEQEKRRKAFKKSLRDYTPMSEWPQPPATPTPQTPSLLDLLKNKLYPEEGRYAPSPEMYNYEVVKGTPQFSGMTPAIATAILNASRKYNFDPFLASAVAKQESNFRPDVISKDYGYGLFQLTPQNRNPYGNPAYNQYTDAQLLDPNLNAELGIAQLLGELEKARTIWGSSEDVYKPIHGMYQFYQGSPGRSKSNKVVEYYKRK